MKKLFVAMVFMACFLGCDNNIQKNNMELTKVRILLPNSNNSRSIDIGEVISNINFFEVAFKDNVNIKYYFKIADIEQGYIEISIPEGNYDILLFAGEKSIYPRLLASSYAQDVDITLIGPNVINMELAIPDLEYIVPSKVTFGAEYIITFIFDTKNPLITSNTITGDSRFGPDGSIKIDKNKLIQNGNIYTYSRTLTAPMESGTIDVVEIHNYFTLFDTSSINTWTIDSKVNFLLSGNPKSIEFVSGADVHINITWPQ